MRILNLYANIGGNRKFWGDTHEIVAVELNPKIAALYQKLWPKDTVVVADAHQYLIDHFHEFDFIWSSPPCPTHSRINISNGINPYKDRTGKTGNEGGNIPVRYPDMMLYQEIILLRTWFRGKFCVENVVSYYEPLIPPILYGSHYFWTNFWFPTNGLTKITRGVNDNTTVDQLAEMKGFDLKWLKENGKGIDMRLALRDMTEPELAKNIFEWVQKEPQNNLFS